MDILHIKYRTDVIHKTISLLSPLHETAVSEGKKLVFKRYVTKVGYICSTLQLLGVKTQSINTCSKFSQGMVWTLLRSFSSKNGKIIQAALFVAICRFRFQYWLYNCCYIVCLTQVVMILVLIFERQCTDFSAIR